MEERSKSVTMPDGREITARAFKYPEDTDKLFEFFSSLPPEQRNYLRFDVTNREWLEKRLALLDKDNHWLFIAELDGEVIGESSLDREPYGWSRHNASLRAVVSEEYEQLGIRQILFNELVTIGEQMGIERLFTEVLGEQRALIERLIQQGFVIDVTRRRYAKDLKGRPHDVVIMANTLHNVWDQLKEQLEELDIRLPDIHGGS